MGFEATFLRNSEQILRARAGLATPLSPLGSTPTSPYVVGEPSLRPGFAASSPVNVPQRRASFSRGVPLSSSGQSRSEALGRLAGH